MGWVCSMLNGRITVVGGEDFDGPMDDVEVSSSASAVAVVELARGGGSGFARAAVGWLFAVSQKGACLAFFAVIGGYSGYTARPRRGVARWLWRRVYFFFVFADLLGYAVADNFYLDFFFFQVVRP